ncbi:response regulator transcription factor [Novosphingobium sp. ZN18A2]|uniref:response regulator transcription factor n=1 Tax=Novosphingobium sp. ZN18A2 TaxID=3079861 RepID=UPI0030D0699E
MGCSVAACRNLREILMFQEVFLISPNDIAREGLSNILQSEGFSIAGAYEDYTGFQTNRDNAKAIVLLDGLDSSDQARTVGDLKDANPQSVIVVLSEKFDLEQMVACFHAGAQGYIIKSIKAAPLIASLRLAAVGERVVPADLMNFFENGGRQSRPESIPSACTEEACLSPREQDVLRCLIAGYSNKVIARELVVCEATVKVHVKAILRKLKVSNRTQAAIWASSHGFSEVRQTA